MPVHANDNKNRRLVTLNLLGVSLLCTLFAGGVSADYQFDAADTYLADASAMPAWAHTLERHAAESLRLHACLADQALCEGRLRGLRHALVKGATLEADAQLRLVNRYINKRRYRRDRRQMTLASVEGGQARLRNHWSTLLEFIDRGGDCEDYATAKYFMLRELGYAADDMRIVVSYDRSVREHHAVLAIRQPDGASWLMGNRQHNPQITTTGIPVHLCN